MPKLVVASHNLRSDALKNLAEELSNQLGYKVWRKHPNNIRSFQLPVTFLGGIDKVSQFTSFHREGVSAPAFATTLEGAKALAGKQVVIRSLIDSSEGKGITIADKELINLNAPLYTEYIPKKKEFRVHVFDSKVIDVQEKRRKRGVDGEKEFQVRNTANGYVFCRDGIVVPSDCHEVALSAVRSLGRTYGAADIIWNEKRDKCYVLEVNSRPGMQGTTVKKYADAIVAGLPDDVRNPAAAVVQRRPAKVAVRAGMKLITTRKGNKVWRTV
jgi:hypothetical protein